MPTGFKSGYKICPCCREASPLARARCRRCAYDYLGDQNFPGQTQVFRHRPWALAAHRQSLTREGVPVAAVLASLVLLLVLFSSLVWLTASQSGHRRYLARSQSLMKKEPRLPRYPTPAAPATSWQRT